MPARTWNPYTARILNTRHLKCTYVKIRTGHPARELRPGLKQKLMRELKGIVYTTAREQHS